MARSVKGDGRAARWDSHRAQRREEFVEAAVRAIDRAGPNASIAEIAAEAGVSKPVIYRYFTDKSELVAAIGEWGARQVADAILPVVTPDLPPRERVAAGVEAYFRTIEEHPQVFLLVIRHHDDPHGAVAGGKAMIAAGLSRILNDGLRDLGLDAGGAEPWAQGLVGLGLTTGEWWLERGTMSREAVIRYTTEFIWHAFNGIAGEYGAQAADVADVAPLRAVPPQEEQA